MARKCQHEEAEGLDGKEDRLNETGELEACHIKMPMWGQIMHQVGGLISSLVPLFVKD